jgi:hypothetical protein
MTTEQLIKDVFARKAAGQFYSPAFVYELAERIQSLELQNKLLLSACLWHQEAERPGARHLRETANGV